MKFKVRDYFRDIQMFYTLIAKVVRIDRERIYYMPLNFDDWNKKSDWFHCRSARASNVEIITEDEMLAYMI